MGSGLICCKSARWKEQHLVVTQRAAANLELMYYYSTVCFIDAALWGMKYSPRHSNFNIKGKLKQHCCSGNRERGGIEVFSFFAKHKTRANALTPRAVFMANVTIPGIPLLSQPHMVPAPHGPSPTLPQSMPHSSPARGGGMDVSYGMGAPEHRQHGRKGDANK